MKRALGDDDQPMPEIVGCSHLQRNAELFETLRDGVRQERPENSLDVELGETQAALHHLSQAAAPGPPHARCDLGGAPQHRTGVVMDVAATHSGRHPGPDDRSDRRAGDRHRTDAEFVERLDGMDVGEAAGTAAPESDGKGRLIPAGSLDAQPLSSSGGGPTIMIAGSVVSSRAATDLTSSRVTAFIRPARLSI